MYDSTPRRWYGTPIEARVRLDPFAQGWLGGSAPFFLSLLFLIYQIFLYHILTLGSSSKSRAGFWDNDPTISITHTI